MNTIRIRKLLESDTLYLPEIQPLIGRNVEIIVREEIGIESDSTQKWDEAARAARELSDYDFEARPGQRKTDLEHASDHLP